MTIATMSKAAIDNTNRPRFVFSENSFLCRNLIFRN